MVQLFLRETTHYRFSLRLIVGNRDTDPPASVLAARLECAKNNLIKAMPFFPGLAMLDMTVPVGTRTAEIGAMVFLIARLAYVPAYMSGLPWLSSLIWLAANVGLIIMAWPLI